MQQITLHPLGLAFDRLFIQSAFADLKLAGGGVLNFYPGNYQLSGFVELADASNVHIDGRGATILADAKAPTATADGDLFRLTRCSNWTVEGLTLDGNRRARGPSEPAVTMRLKGCSDFKIRDVRFLDSTCDGLFIAADVPGKLETSCSDGVIQDCLFDKARRNSASVVAGHHLKFLVNRFRNILESEPKAGIDFESNREDAEGANHHIQVQGNSFQDCFRAAIVENARNPYSLTFDGNTVERCTYGIGQNDSPVRDTSRPAAGIVARGNILEDIGQICMSIFGDGGELSGNRIGKCGNIPLYVDGGKNLVLENYSIPANMPILPP